MTVSETFTLPKLADNTRFWGPVNLALPASLNEVPYAPFSKGDNVGRAADWTSQYSPYGADGRDGNSMARNRRMHRGSQMDVGGGVTSAFAYFHAADDDGSFSVVDHRPASGPSSRGRGGFSGSSGGAKFGYGAGRGGARTAQSTQGQGQGQRGPGGPGGNRTQGQTPNVRGRGGRGGSRGNFGGGRKYTPYNQPQRVREASVVITADWKLLDEIPFSALSKLSFDAGDATDIEAYGSLNYFDKAFDRITTKLEKPLLQVDRAFYNPTSSADPILQKLADEIPTPAVFATDIILAALMCSIRSIYPWDLVITKHDGKIFIDKRDGVLDFVTVNENTPEPPADNTDDMNGSSSLGLEATYINRNFSQMVLKDSDKYLLPNPDPFHDSSSEDPAASTIHRYRQWSLGDNITLVARTTVDAALLSTPTPVPEKLVPTHSAQSPETTQFMSIRTLTEFDSKQFGNPDWRQKLDIQKGAVIATEIKSNSYKMSRWTMESILSGVEVMKFGFVSRINPKDRAHHGVLGTANFKPREFAAQMNLMPKNGWGILKALVDLVIECEDGKFVLVKDPNKPTLRLYQVPIATFEEDDDVQDNQDDM